MNIIHIDNISKKYNKGKTSESIALNNINLDIDKGEFVAITGASGAGKSTLLHIIGCIDKASSGTYLLDGIDVTNISKAEMAITRNKKFGFVLQDFGLINDDNVLKNVALPLMFNKTKLSEIDSTALRQLKNLGIDHLKNRTVGDLSGGEKQRVAIARALVNDPDIILADEPTGSLDSENSELIINIFRKLNGIGKTVILITHEIDIANKCNRILKMLDGKIISDNEMRYHSIKSEMNT